jgi:uncharacterized protein YcbK (DUF882 family)
MKYFTLNEFDCPSHQGSGVNMDGDFIAKLEQAREIAGIPFKINSGYRTKERNEQVGGVSNSSHLIGVAADIAVGSGHDRYVILSALIKAGFRRIGVAKTFIHCDTDDSKPNSVWTY